LFDGHEITALDRSVSEVQKAHSEHQHALRQQEQRAAYARAFRARLEANAVLRQILDGHREAVRALTIPPLPAGWHFDPDDTAAVDLQLLLARQFTAAWTAWHGRLSADFGVLLAPDSEVRCGDRHLADRVMHIVDVGFGTAGGSGWLARRSGWYRSWRAAVALRAYARVARELQNLLLTCASARYERVRAALDEGDRAMLRRLRGAERGLALAATAVDASHAGWLAAVRERGNLVDA
jgi:hypothetical protein